MMHVESNVNSVIDPKESIHFPISYCVRYSHYLALQTICGVADSANKHDDVTNGSVYVSQLRTINAILSEVMYCLVFTNP